MAYSSINRKTCKCGCTNMPTISYEGYYHQHAPKEVLDRLEVKQKRKNAVKKDLTKLRVVEVESDDNRSLAKKYDRLDKWFKERRKEMQNVCCECGKPTNVGSDKYYKWSVCHIAPKALIPSVATDVNNWVELCWLHHQEFDSTFDKAAAMMCFGEVKQKFQLFKNLIPPEQLRKINPHLLT